jgi:peptidoglycan/LPS O-acetylase OafA/YrhL
MVRVQMRSAIDDPTAAATQSRHIPALDGLRAIAILSVFAYHTVRTLDAHGLAAKGLVDVSAGGWMGVDLFFVLSGFLITGILLDARGTPGYYRVFALRRALRILPLYYVVLVALVIGSTFLSGGAAADGAALRGVQGWYWIHLADVLVARDGFPGAPLHTGHFWSLAVEEQFYLVWPLVVAACSLTALRRVCAAMIAIALMTRVALVLYTRTSPLAAAYTLPFARIDTLALGAWLAIVARQPGGLAELWPRLRWAGAIGLGTLVAIALATHSLQWGTRPMQTVGYTAVALVAAATLVLTIRATGLAHRTLTARPLEHIGRRSYALYVIHYPLIALADHAGISGDTVAARVHSQPLGLLLWMVVLFGVTLALAEISWIALERPCLALKERIAGRTVRRAAHHAREESGTQVPSAA